MATHDSVDYVIVGIGSSRPEFISSRSNAGYIFADYIANCISMQTTLLENAEAASEITSNMVPKAFKKPLFYERPELMALVNDSIFPLTEAEMSTLPESQIPEVARKTVKKQLRVLVIKGLTEPKVTGTVVERVLSHYNITDTSQQLIVATYDVDTLPGCVGIQHGSDVRGVNKNNALSDIIQRLGHSNFIRLGVGADSDIDVEKYLSNKFNVANGEVDKFGYTLDVTGQAFQHLVSFQDLKSTKKKFAKTHKLPKKLRNLPGLLFPIDVVYSKGKEETAEVEKTA